MKKFLSFILVTVMLLTLVPMAYAASDVKKVGDVIQFGAYPQTEVTDNTLIDTLNSRAPAWEEWTSYGYYSGEGIYGSMVLGDWMRYTEVSYNGSKYRGVRFTQCRPNYTYTSSSASYTDNNYRTYTNYWFKYEPLEWRVLDPSTGLVICETIIDSQPYSNTVYQDPAAASETYAFFNDSVYKSYANDYETSSIRKWLNEDFYNAAFTSGEKSEIATTSLNNDGYYTITGYTDYKSLDSNGTDDKVFLLSYDEVLNTAYGFKELCDTADSARSAKGSDYAKCQGLWVSGDYCKGNSYWLLRTPGNKTSSCCYVNIDGFVYHTYSVNKAGYGIRPAISLSSVIHSHSYNSQVTAPDCLDGGYTTYTCICGHSYVADYTDALGHKDDNGDSKCDFNCGHIFETESEDDEPAEESKGFFEKLWDHIKMFLKKLFGWINFD